MTDNPLLIAALATGLLIVFVCCGILGVLLFRHHAAYLRITDVTKPGGPETWRIVTPAGPVVAERVLHPDKGEVYRLRAYFRRNLNPPEEFVPPARALVVRRAIDMANRHMTHGR